MQLRQLVPPDAAAFKALRIFAMQESPHSFGSSVEDEQKRPLESLEKMFSSDIDARFGVFDQERLVAIAGYACQNRVKTRHKADIFGVYVHPDYRGQGLSRKLMEKIIEDSKARGLETLLLAVTEGNSAAYSLYKSLGFLEYGIEPDALRVDGQSIGEIFMRLELG